MKLLLFLTILPLGCYSQNWYSETTTYQYDNLNRLVQVNYDDGRVYNYMYDSLGNRLEIVATEPRDIYLENVTATPLSVYPGDNIYVTLDYKYNGLDATWDLPPFYLGYYLSNTGILGIGNILLATDSAYISMNNDTEFMYQELTIPQGTPSGSYWILIHGDMNDDLSNEDDESNNVEVIGINVLSTASISEEINKTITLFPNPTNDMITVEMSNISGLGELEIFISDMNGKTVIEKNMIPQDGKISLETKLLESGVYVIEIIDQDHTWKEFFIKE